jgi:hypothetical protein
MKDFTPIPLSEASDLNPLPEPATPREGKYLYIRHPRVVDLPASGCVTFRFTRNPVTVTEPLNGKPGSASVELHLTEICGYTADEDAAESATKSVEDELDEAFREYAGKDEDADDNAGLRD